MRKNKSTFSVVPAPDVTDLHDRYDGPVRAQEPSIAPGKREEAAHSNHSPKGGREEDLKLQKEGSERGGSKAQTAQGTSGGRKRTRTQEGGQSCAIHVEQGEAGQEDKRRKVDETRRAQLEAARARAIQVRKERSEIKREEKRLKDQLYEEKRKELEAIRAQQRKEREKDKLYTMSPCPQEPPSPQALKELKPKPPSPFRRGYVPKQGQAEPASCAGEETRQDRPPSPSFVPAPENEDDREIEDDELRRMKEEREAMERRIEEEEGRKIDEELRAMERMKRIEERKKLLEIEKERQRIATRIYKQKMEENRMRLLSHAVFGT